MQVLHQELNFAESMKVTSSTNIPGNIALETLLKQASVEPAWRPAFYRELLISSVLVLVPDHIIKPNSQGDLVMRFIQWGRIDGTSAIPFFSSARTLSEAVSRVEVTCLPLDVPTFFELTRGALLHLNPYSECNVELFPDDVESLLANGCLVTPKAFNLKIERPLLSRPITDPPLPMLNALALLYSQQPSVKAAHLALVVGLYKANETSLVIALDVDDDPQAVIRDSSLVIRDTYRGKLSIDIVHLDEELKLSNPAFLQAQCFYDRRMSSMLLVPSASRSLQ